MLGYKKTDNAVRQYVSNLDVLKRYVSTPIISQGVATGKFKRMQMLFVTESGFYALVMGSQLEAVDDQMVRLQKSAENRMKGMVVNSRIWLHRLMGAITAARDRGESIWITIV